MFQRLNIVPLHYDRQRVIVKVIGWFLGILIVGLYAVTVVCGLNNILATHQYSLQKAEFSLF
jgi:hypothetical protein